MCSGESNGSAEKDTGGAGAEKGDADEAYAEKSLVCVCQDLPCLHLSCTIGLLPPSLTAALSSLALSCLNQVNMWVKASVLFSCHIPSFWGCRLLGIPDCAVLQLNSHFISHHHRLGMSTSHTHM